MTRLKLVLLALVLALAGLGVTSGPAVAESGDSGDNGCTTSNWSGGLEQGSWSRTYNAGCNNNVIGKVVIQWNNYTGSGGDHHVSGEAWVTADSLVGGKCLSVVFDWYNPLDSNGHADAQEARNCRVGTTYHSVNMPQDLNTQSWTGSRIWRIRRMQIATVDASTLAVTRKACPTAFGAPPDSYSDADCTGWRSNGAAPWSTTAAKIYRKWTDGSTNQNDPKYPSGGYDAQAVLASAF
jgi:hypothetical protein